MTSTTPFTELDVRPLFAQGRPPLPAILEAVGALPTGHGLRLIAPMEPTPLYALLGKQGFLHEARAQPDGSWEILFRPAAPAELDLRDLPPPEPMQRALEAVAELPAGASLTLLTRFRPVHLLEHLAPRGYSGISEELPDNSWRTGLSPQVGVRRAPSSYPFAMTDAVPARTPLRGAGSAVPALSFMLSGLIALVGACVYLWGQPALWWATEVEGRY